MRTEHHTVLTDLDRYYIFYGGHKSDTGVDLQIDMDMVFIRVRKKTTRFRCVFCTSDGYDLKELGKFRLGLVRLGWKYSR
jgi:hypothetical protein